MFTDSAMIVRTKHENTINVLLIATNNYIKSAPNQFLKYDYIGDSFEISEYVDGKVCVTVRHKLRYSNVETKNVITISNVIQIEIMTNHIEQQSELEDCRICGAHKSFFIHAKTADKIRGHCSKCGFYGIIGTAAVYLDPSLRGCNIVEMVKEKISKGEIRFL